MCPDTPAKLPKKTSLSSHVQPCFSSASRTAELAYLGEVSHTSSWWPCFWSLGPTLAAEHSGMKTRPWRVDSNPYKSINQAGNLGGSMPMEWSHAREISDPLDSLEFWFGEPSHALAPWVGNFPSGHLDRGNVWFIFCLFSLGLYRRKLKFRNLEETVPQTSRCRDGNLCSSNSDLSVMLTK